MKNIITLALMVLTLSIFAQNPCQDGTIIINGNATDAVLLENSNNTGLKLPLWLDAGTTLAAGNRVQIISVIEFNEVNNAGNISLVYSKVIKVGTQTETVPAGKVWKVESIVKHANAFVAGFTASSNSPVCAGSQLNLSASSVAGATYSWTGPNGFTSALQNPVITNVSLAASGTYTMTATLNGCTSNATTTDVVVNALPSATFTYGPAFPIVNYNVSFTPSVSGLSYSWIFDSGTPAASSIESPLAIWSTAGNYDVSLTVTDNNSCSATSQQVVPIHNCVPGQPSSAFTWLPAAPESGQSVTFTPNVTGASYDWTFTGGSIGSSNLQSPSVTWSNDGTYSVSLTVTSGGCQTTTTESFIVKTLVTQTYNYTGSIQNFVVPAGVTSITMEAWGAQGGDHAGISTGGNGAYIKGDVQVTPGSTLSIIVGQQGIDDGNGAANGGSGGGGGSFIYSGTTLYIAAGGGGGGSLQNDGPPKINGDVGQITTSGSASKSGYAGGTNGSDGSGSFYGKGWNSIQSSPAGIGYGGYGGGGTAWYHGGGGGGGYSGGGGNTSGGNGCNYGDGGGGGGSYNAGTNQTNTAGVKSGNGQVKLTY